MLADSIAGSLVRSLNFNLSLLLAQFAYHRVQQLLCSGRLIGVPGTSRVCNTSHFGCVGCDGSLPEHVPSCTTPSAVVPRAIFLVCNYPQALRKALHTAKI